MTSRQDGRGWLIDSRMDRRAFLRRLGAGSALAASAGSLPLIDARGAALAGKKGGRITEVALGDMVTFNPVLSADVYSGNASEMIYDPLFMVDHKGNVLPCLAAAMPKTSNGGRTYTVTIRSDARWTDGNPVTADDVKMTYDFIISPTYTEVNAPNRTTFSQHLQSTSVVDPHTIEFTTSSVYAPFMLQMMSVGILPKSVYGSLSPSAINTTPANTKPTVTSGAFMNAVWTSEQQTTFQRNPNYYRGAALVDEYVIKPVASSTNVLNLLLSGEADIGQIDNSQYQAAKSNSKLNASIVQPAEFVSAVLQMDPAKSRLFQDERVRQALFWATDREGIVKSIYFGFAKVANGPIPPVMSRWYDAKVKPQYSYDPAKANKLLEAAGFKKGKDGIRAKGDLKLSFQVLVPDTDQVEIQMTTAMQSQWKKVGINIDIKPADLDTVIVPALNVNYNFTMIIVGDGVGPDPDTSEFWATRSASAVSYNSGDYSNPQLDKVMNQAVATLDTKERKKLYNQASSMLMTDPPRIFLVYPEEALAVSKRVLGYPTGVPINSFVNRQSYINKLETTNGQ